MDSYVDDSMCTDEVNLTEGLTNLNLEDVVNIDALDTDNELAQVEYVEDLYNYYKNSETEGGLKDYMRYQSDINTVMRASLIDWIVDVHNRFDLMHETLYLAINLIDRYLSVSLVAKENFQLLGLTALFIASKHEDLTPPKVSALIYMSDLKYTRDDLLAMEKTVLGQLGWYVTVPTAYVFTVRYAKASFPSDKEMEKMVFFYTELGLMDYTVVTSNKPSKLAASAVYAARCTLKKTPRWTPTLKHYTGYTEEQVRDCAQSLVEIHLDAASGSWLVCTKYKWPVVNIDIRDIDNELAELDYVDDLYAYYVLSETECGPRDYMADQIELNTTMRATLIDWIIDVHKRYNLMRETLYLTINIIDRYLSVRPVTKNEFQLVGITALFVASKLEEHEPPKVNALISISGNIYKRDDILAMEHAILGQLGWYLTVPTTYVFAVRYAKASFPCDKKMEKLVFFYTELGLMDYTIVISNKPSKLAASAVYAARYTLKKEHVWTETLTHYTGYTEEQVIDCGQSLVNIHGVASESKLKAVYRKYIEHVVHKH